MKTNVRKCKWLLLLILIPAFLFLNIIEGYTQNQDNKSSKDIQSETRDSAGPNIEETTQSNINAGNGFEDEAMEVKGTSLYYTAKQGGPLMIVLLIFAVISLTLIIERIIFFTKNKIWDIKQIEKYLKNASEKLKVKFREDMEDGLKKEFQIYSNRLEKGLSLLSGIGQLAPIVGFLGTVLGMINAFASIAVATTVNAKVVAVGIQIALITTAGGLLIAAPTLTCFYFFMHIIQNRYIRSEEIIKEICENMPKLSDKI